MITEEKNKVQTILLCQYAIPFSKIGSWTTMYKKYIESEANKFDYVICPELDTEPIKDVKYSFFKKKTLMTRLKSKFSADARWENYLKALDKVIEPRHRYVIQIVDNKGLVLPLQKHLEKKYKRSQFYIQYYYQGFSPLFLNANENKFLYAIDEMIFLTALSYKAYKNYYNDFVPKASVLYNATSSEQFFKLTDDKKIELKRILGLNSKLTFIWCSQDRPKKGLKFLLQVWKKIYEKFPNEVELLIVGAASKVEQNGVRVIGRVPNDQLAKYYQVSDFFLFPSLWKEGFGIVLAEALKCGCYCIASDQGGISEVLQFGKLGKLIENPNFIEEWEMAIFEGIKTYKDNDYKNPYFEQVNEDLYDMKKWSNKMNKLIEEAKSSLS